MGGRWPIVLAALTASDLALWRTAARVALRVRGIMTAALLGRCCLTLCASTAGPPREHARRWPDGGLGTCLQHIRMRRRAVPGTRSSGYWDLCFRQWDKGGIHRRRGHGRPVRGSDDHAAPVIETGDTD